MTPFVRRIQDMLRGIGLGLAAAFGTLVPAALIIVGLVSLIRKDLIQGDGTVTLFLALYVAALCAVAYFVFRLVTHPQLGGAARAVLGVLLVAGVVATCATQMGSSSSECTPSRFIDCP